MLSRRRIIGLGVVAAVGIGVSGCGRDNSTGKNADELLDVARDAYVFGYPLVLSDVTNSLAAPVNTLSHAQTLAQPSDQRVVRNNRDTLYSSAVLDLHAEPVVLQVPAIEAGRYWLMQMMDMWTNTPHNPGSAHPQLRAGAPAGPFTYALTGPGWSGNLPEDITPLPMPSDTARLLSRIQVNGEADVAAVRVLQQQMKLAPLSAWIAGGVTGGPGSAPGQPGVSAATQVAAMDGPTFFSRMCALMAANPPAAADASALKRFASVGLAPGATVGNLPADVLNSAVAQAKKQVADYRDPAGKNANGWLYYTDLGTYGTDYQLRATTALYGFAANLAEDSIYPTVEAVADDNGTPRRFRLQFEPGQRPPADAFWSITAYNADSHLFDNPAHIYTVGHEIPPVLNPDGSLEIAVQSADPGPSTPQGNWLPIPPTGKFSLTMRLYAPRPEALDGRWKPPHLAPTT